MSAIWIIERRERRKGARWKAWSMVEPNTRKDADHDLSYWQRQPHYKGGGEFRARKYQPVRGK